MTPKRLNSKKHCCPAIVIEVTCLRESVYRADLCVCVAGPLNEPFYRRLSATDNVCLPIHRPRSGYPLLFGYPPDESFPLREVLPSERRASDLTSASLSLALTTLDASRSPAAACRLIACFIPSLSLSLPHPRLRELDALS